MSLQERVAIRSQNRSRKKTIPQRERMTVGEYLLLRLHTFGITHLIQSNCQHLQNLQKLIRNCQFMHPLTLSTSEHAIQASFGYSLEKGFSTVILPHAEIAQVIPISSLSFCENYPILLLGISTQAEEHYQTEKFQQTNSLLEKAFRTVMLDSSLLDSPKDAPSKIDEIIETSFESKKPCYLQIPDSILFEKIQPHISVKKKPLKSDPENLHEALRLTLFLTKKSQHTVFYIDSGAIYPTCKTSFLQILKNTKSSCSVTTRAKNTFWQLDTHSPLSKSEDLVFYFGFEGNFTQDALKLLENNSKHKIFSHFDKVIIDDIVFEDVYIEEYCLALSNVVTKQKKEIEQQTASPKKTGTLGIIEETLDDQCIVLVDTIIDIHGFSFQKTPLSRKPIQCDSSWFSDMIQGIQAASPQRKIVVVTDESKPNEHACIVQIPSSLKNIVHIVLCKNTLKPHISLQALTKELGNLVFSNKPFCMHHFLVAH